jgi:hypothetical protein
VNKPYVQDAPFAVQFELTEGCNLRCTFCGLNGIREPKINDYKCMTPEILSNVMHQIVKAGWNPRVEFAMRGEPTMHPDYVQMIKTARTFAPRLQLMMTSNAGGLMRRPGPLANVRALFDAGLNILALDDYTGVNFVGKVRTALHESGHLSIGNGEGHHFYGADGVSFNVYEYPDNKEGNPHQRVGHNGRMLSFIKAIDVAEDGTHATLSNHAGVGAAPNDNEYGSRCAKPFRELAVRFDGNVSVCCNDWRGVYKCGTLLEEGGLLKVWNGAAMNAARQKLMVGERDFGPCKGCDARSYRVGLLPDKFGKVTLPLPDAKTAAAIAKAVSGPSYTAPVLRPWELTEAEKASKVERAK